MLQMSLSDHTLHHSHHTAQCHFFDHYVAAAHIHTDDAIGVDLHWKASIYASMPYTL